MDQSTQMIKSFIKVYLMAAIGISLFQELSKINHPPSLQQGLNGTGNYTTPQPQSTQFNISSFPKIQNVVIKATDRYQSEIRTILAKKSYNVEITNYEFIGPQWWYNLFLTYGHILVMYALIGKYRSQTNESTKKKIMIIGAVGIVSWMMFSHLLKIQRITIQYRGALKYSRQIVNEDEIIAQISELQDENDFQEPVF